jgi:4-diphosphocytidyl-2-C-methyl-D-erythritol kinase
MPPLQSLLIRAHAKINLALAVGPPAPPRGYHPIASWFTCIGLHDELSLARSVTSDSKWTIEWASDAPRQSPIDWPIEKDLAVRAHRLLELAADRTLPVRATLTKRTPVGAGLGGGSADAAAAFVGINELFSLGLSREKLRELSTSLGSDIAFFIDDVPLDQPARPAIVTGFGERIERLAPCSGWAALFFPPFGCPTGPVYQAFDRASPGPLREADIRSLTRTAAADLPTAPLFNDLAAPACSVEPRLAEMLASLGKGLDAPVHVTGSGSTMFALAHTEGHAAQLAADARRLCPELAAVATPLL